MGVKVGLATIDDELLAYMLREGYVWSEERQCYFMEHEKFRTWNNKPIPNRPMTIGIDNVPRSVFYGDTGKSFTQILQPT